LVCSALRSFRSLNPISGSPRATNGSQNPRGWTEIDFTEWTALPNFIVIIAGCALFLARRGSRYSAFRRRAQSHCFLPWAQTVGLLRRSVIRLCNRSPPPVRDLFSVKDHAPSRETPMFSEFPAAHVFFSQVGVFYSHLLPRVLHFHPGCPSRPSYWLRSLSMFFARLRNVPTSLYLPPRINESILDWHLIRIFCSIFRVTSSD